MNKTYFSRLDEVSDIIMEHATNFHFHNTLRDVPMKKNFAELMFANGGALSFKSGVLPWRLHSSACSEPIYFKAPSPAECYAISESRKIEAECCCVASPPRPRMRI